MKIFVIFFNLFAKLGHEYQNALNFLEKNPMCSQKLIHFLCFLALWKSTLQCWTPCSIVDILVAPLPPLFAIVVYECPQQQWFMKTASENYLWRCRTSSWVPFCKSAHPAPLRKFCMTFHSLFHSRCCKYLGLGCHCYTFSPKGCDTLERSRWKAEIEKRKDHQVWY